ncbi:MAG TPA: YdbL family protein [Alphaproteobacteria bacterium]|nr:YdbL family protein [Alphaproteobacteria bacterium]
MKFRWLAVLAFIAAFTALPAYALDLHGARAAGAVGEGLDGYVVGLQQTPDVQALVSDVNAKRKQEYARISKEKGQPVDVVGKLAAEEIINSLPPGSSYQGADGSWKKR